jgi:signal transduction histidine kinase
VCGHPRSSTPVGEPHGHALAGEIAWGRATPLRVFGEWPTRVGERSPSPVGGRMRPPSARQLAPRRMALGGSGALALLAVLIPVFRLQGLSWGLAIAAAVLFVAPCVLLGSAVWRLLIRPVTPKPPGRALALHTVTAVAFSLSWTIVFSGLAYLVVRPESMEAFLRGGVLWQFVWGLVIYGGLAQAARAHQRLRALELATVGADLQALRAQLNPHFLFNTLHSLTQLAREDPIATQDALERFGALMRYVLDAGRHATDDVPLEDEIGFVRNYLAVEQLRLGDRLGVVEQIDPDALELAVPPLLLQPLVENAVRHGLAPRRDGGTLRLTARAQDGALVIEVADDGVGAEPGVWRRSPGLGLKSVRRQLDAHFPGAGDLEITTRPQAGFAVRLRIPARLPVRGVAS